MKTKEIVLASLLLATGLVLHAITPPILGGVKPDFLLATMFIAIISQPKLSNTLLIGIVAGILAAMTTGFPGGQIPNIIDKLVSALFVFMVLKILPIKTNDVIVGVLGFVATIVSGIVFLSTALLIVGLPAPLSALFVAVVLPTAIANTVVSVVLYRVYKILHNRASAPVLSN